jgi:hypothetical protein
MRVLVVALLGVLVVPVIFLVVYLVYLAVGLLIHLAVWIFWLPKGKDLLFVYSDSPIWHAYIETEILPHVRTRAVVLNWSERRHWPMGFRYFGGSRNFNPMAVVFCAAVPAKVVRFYQPFRDFKHGKRTAVEAARRDLFKTLGVDLSEG